ncbi:MAG: type IV secretion protein DotG [Alphaproteobacteria bacterium]|nr:type IV secretion protein DotG [Alphaproteobacteria bacterium]
MTTQNDDNMDFGDDNFDDFEEKSNTLGDVLRQNTWAKIGIVAGAAVVIFGVIYMFGGQEANVPPSVVPTGSDVRTAPGTTQSSPAYIEAVKEQNETRVESAIKQGQSALPTPIDTPRGALGLNDQQEPEEDPLQRWRRLQEERLERESQRRRQDQQLRNQPLTEDTAATANQEAVKQMADVMSQQMDVILQNRATPSVRTMNLTSPQWLEDQRAQEEEVKAQEEAAAKAAAQTGSKVLIPAGEIIYAQTLTEANSDNPGPVLAQIAVGPLHGARLLGDFSTREDVLVLNFNTMVVDGVSYGIDAVALDPDSTLPGLATDVDHRYWKRIILPMAANFIEGMASAISESGRTSVTVTGETVAEETEPTTTRQEVASGIEEAGQEAGDILDDIAGETKPLIIVATGTPFGLLFLDTVYEDSEITSSTATTNSATNTPTTSPGR